jgi:hypothetical protein
MANTIIYQALWENKLAQRLDKPQNWKEVNDVVYSDTQTYNFPLVSTANEPAVATLTNTAAGRSTLTNVIPFIDVTETNQTLSIITAEIDSVYLDYADQAQSNYAKMAEMGTLLGKKIGERAEAISLANHGSWTNIGDNGGGAVGLTTTTLTISANNVDDVVRGVIEQIYTANGFNLYKENGGFIEWRPADWTFMVQFMQANGFNMADAALKNGGSIGVDYLGLNHYVSTAHAAGHVMGGVRGVQKFGILKSTFGKTYTNEMPAYTASGGGSTGGSLSGTQIHTRLDYGLLVPTNLLPVIYDINVA